MTHNWSKLREAGKAPSCPGRAGSQWHTESPNAFGSNLHIHTDTQYKIKVTWSSDKIFNVAKPLNSRNLNLLKSVTAGFSTPSFCKGNKQVEGVKYGPRILLL